MTRVLVVDDEPDVRFILRLILEREGYEVDAAINGAVALECVKEAHPDLVITDLMMPVMDGNELVERLRSDPDTATIPIMSLTGNTDSSVGADLVIMKFPAPSELLAAVRSVMGGDK